MSPNTQSCLPLSINANTHISIRQTIHIPLVQNLEWNARFFEIQEHEQRGRKIPIIFESRRRNEDRTLEEEFKKMVEQSNLNGIKGMFDFHCISKKANLPGLQLADLVARPIGVHYLHPEQHNRAWEMLLPKMRTSHDGKLEGYGLKIYPQFDPTE